MWFVSCPSPASISGVQKHTPLCLGRACSNSRNVTWSLWKEQLHSSDPTLTHYSHIVSDIPSPYGSKHCLKRYLTLQTTVIVNYIILIIPQSKMDPYSFLIVFQTKLQLGGHHLVDSENGFAVAALFTAPGHRWLLNHWRWASHGGSSGPEKSWPRGIHHGTTIGEP